MKKFLVLIALLALGLTNNSSFGSIYNANTLKSKLKKHTIKNKFKEILFHYGDLKNADLSYKSLRYIDFHRTNFKGANLQHTKLYACDFKKTNLRTG